MLTDECREQTVNVAVSGLLHARLTEHAQTNNFVTMAEPLYTRLNNTLTAESKTYNSYETRERPLWIIDDNPMLRYIPVLHDDPVLNNVEPTVTFKKEYKFKYVPSIIKLNIVELRYRLWLAINYNGFDYVLKHTNTISSSSNMLLKISKELDKERDHLIDQYKSCKEILKGNVVKVTIINEPADYAIQITSDVKAYTYAIERKGLLSNNYVTDQILKFQHTTINTPNTTIITPTVKFKC